MAVTNPPNLAIPEGSLILITGITGFVASHVAKQFLERGYRVRGTVRSIGKAAWVLDDALSAHRDSVELVEVQDLGVEGAFDEAVRGGGDPVSAIVHVASVVSFSTVPEEVIPPTIAGTRVLLEAALRQPSVKRFVYCSSVATQTAESGFLGDDTYVTPYSFNDHAVRVVEDGSFKALPRASMLVYSASKTLTEKFLWEFVSKNRPQYVVNTVHPANIIGEPTNVVHTTHIYSFISQPYAGNEEVLAFIQRSAWMVDVKDTALLHVAAALDPDVREARLSAWGLRRGRNDVLAAIHAARPGKTNLPATMPDYGDPRFPTTDDSASVALLKKWGNGQEGWTPFQQSVEESLKYSD